MVYPSLSTGCLIGDAALTLNSTTRGLHWDQYLVGTATTLSWELAASYSVVACTVFARAAPTINLIRKSGERLFLLQFLEPVTEL